MNYANIEKILEVSVKSLQKITLSLQTLLKTSVQLWRLSSRLCKV